MDHTARGSDRAQHCLAAHIQAQARRLDNGSAYLTPPTATPTATEGLVSEHEYHEVDRDHRILAVCFGP